MVNKKLIEDFLLSRGVLGFVFSGSHHCLMGAEISIEDCSPGMAKRLFDACNDALISRGGGGLGGKKESGGSYAYRQISPELFSDPWDRAEAMLQAFEANGSLPLDNDFKIGCDGEGNLFGPSGQIIRKADHRTKPLKEWVDEIQRHRDGQIVSASVQRGSTGIDVQSSVVRNILRTLQEGEISVSRAVECLEAVEAGTFNEATWLPPVSCVFGEDDIPADVVRRLRSGMDCELVKERVRG